MVWEFMDFLAYNAFLFVVYFFSWAQVTPFTGPSRAPDSPEEVTRKLKKGSQWKKNSSAPNLQFVGGFKMLVLDPGKSGQHVRWGKIF